MEPSGYLLDREPAPRYEMPFCSRDSRRVVNRAVCEGPYACYAGSYELL